MIFKDVSIKLNLQETLVYFDIIFSKSLSIEAFRLEWDYYDASKLHIEFEESAGDPIGKFLTKEGEQEIITMVLQRMKKDGYCVWKRWGFDKILIDRLK